MSVKSQLETGTKKSGPLEIFVILAVYFLVVIFTTPVDLADTALYAGEVVNHYFSPTTESLSRILEFGHILWRPLSLAYLKAVGFVSETALKTPEQAKTFLLTSWLTFNVILGGLCLLVFWAALRLIALPPLARLFSVLTLLFTSAFLNHLDSGTPYMAGLLFTTASLWAGIRACMSRHGERLFAVLSGTFLAVAAGFWFTYILVAAAIVLLPFWLPMTEVPQTGLVNKIRKAALAAIALATVLFAIYLLPAVKLGISSLEDVLVWVDRSTHGLRQSIKIVRAVMGLPRCCLELGQSGIPWKRWLFHDPYSPVSLQQAFTAGIPLLLAFYAFFAFIFLTLWRSHEYARRIFLGLALSFGPVFLFATLLHEPSSRERFMPAFPFVFLAVAEALRHMRGKVLLVPALFLGLQATINVSELSSASIKGQWAKVQSRSQQLELVANSTDRIYVVTLRDPLYVLIYHTYPGLLGWKLSIPVDLVTLATEKVLVWKNLFAEDVLKKWQQGGHVWISKRVLAERPKPEWLWVEGEDPAIKWSDIPAFFRQLEFDMDVGGEDGFVRLAQSEHNRKILEALLANSTQTANDAARGQ